MILLTPVIYATGAVLSLIISVGVYRSYRKSENMGLEYLSLALLFLSLHSFALSIPAFLNPGNLKMIGQYYIVGTVFLFLLLLTSFKVQTDLHRGFFKKHSFIINTIILGIGVFIVGLEIYDFRFPIFGEQGLIFWNVNPVAGWLTGVTSLVYGLIWADFFQQARKLVSDSVSKIKMLVLSIDGIILGISALLVFTSKIEIVTLVGHILFIVACVITILMFFAKKKEGL